MSTKSTNGIIKDLNSLGKSKKNEEKERNKTVCRMVNVQLQYFFDDIYIPIKFFRDGGWDIEKVLNENEDCLFFNNTYLAVEDYDKFYKVFEKFVSIVRENLSSENKLFAFLKKWTDTSKTKWKEIPMGSYLKVLLTHPTYQVISPAYTTNVYYDVSKKYNNDVPKIKEIMEKHLDNIIGKMEKETIEFKKIYKKIISSYVYEYPINDIEMEDIYILGFINSIILAILEFADKLLDLKIYAVHQIITDIIEYHTPLDEINRYDPKEHGNKKLCIV